jgi:hypothetical protein
VDNLLMILFVGFILWQWGYETGKRS